MTSRSEIKELDHEGMEQAPVEQSKPWLKQIPDREANEYYDNVVNQILLTDIATAQQVARLKLHYSQFVGQIDTPEKAIDHIQACYKNNVPIGGSNELAFQDKKEIPFGMTAEYVKELEVLQKQATEEARNAWKEAIRKRKIAMREWDNYVRNLHDRFSAFRDMNLTQFEKVLKR